MVPFNHLNDGMLIVNHYVIKKEEKDWYGNMVYVHIGSMHNFVIPFNHLNDGMLIVNHYVIKKDEKDWYGNMVYVHIGSMHNCFMVLKINT